MPFFQPTVTATRPVSSLIPKCGACGLYKNCLSPKMPVTGDGRLGILIIGEAPGEQEDKQNEQFVGSSGMFLRETLAKYSIDLDRDCWKTNALICRPKDNRTPASDEIDYCRPNLLKAIDELKPTIIIPLGGPAIRSLLGPLWREDTGPVSQWVGWKIPLQKWNAWVCPTFHPSYVKRQEDKPNGKVVKLWFEKHLTAVGLQRRPWAEVPDYEKQIELIYDPDIAADVIEKWLEHRNEKFTTPISFDYETNRLKPDHPNAEIVCCSVCFGGERTIAFPWAGQVRDAMGALLNSKHPKIGANTKFEDRWTRRVFGFPVRNWVWDCVNDAHVLDNRRGITSVKFQAFVRLGLPDWSYSIRPFLEDTNEYGVNRIREVDLRTLLLYCGIDSLVEFKIAQSQRKEMRR